MHVHRRLLPAFSLSAIVLAVAAGVASAVPFTDWIATPRPFTASSSGVVTVSTLGVTARCNLTLSGSFNSSIVPRVGASAGTITRTSLSGCSGGAMAFLALPWSVTYSSYSGTRPEGMTGWLTTVNGVSVSLVEIPREIWCLFRGNVGLNFALTGSGPYSLGTVSVLANRLASTSERTCTSGASMTGSFTSSATSLIVPPDGLLLTVDSRPFPFIFKSELEIAPVTIWFRNETANPVTVLAATFTTARWEMSATADCVRTINPGQRCFVTVRLPGTIPGALKLTGTGVPPNTYGRVDIVRD